MNFYFIHPRGTRKHLKYCSAIQSWMPSWVPRPTAMTPRRSQVQSQHTGASGGRISWMVPVSPWPLWSCPGKDMGKRMRHLLEIMRRNPSPLPPPEPTQGPPPHFLACLEAPWATVPLDLVVTVHPWPAADNPLAGSSKLQEANKTSPNEWLALQ